MNNTYLTKISFRQDTSSNWRAANPILGIGEPGFEIDTNLFKIGNGTTNWNNLPYQTSDGSIIPEVPADGNLYGRTRTEGSAQGEWQEINIPVGEAPKDGKYYVRCNGVWTENESKADKFTILVPRNIQISDISNQFSFSSTISVPSEDSYLILSDSETDLLRITYSTDGTIVLADANNLSTNQLLYSDNTWTTNFTPLNITSEGQPLGMEFNNVTQTLTFSKSLQVTSIDNTDIANITFIQVNKVMNLIDVYNEINSSNDINIDLESSQTDVTYENNQVTFTSNTPVGNTKMVLPISNTDGNIIINSNNENNSLNFNFNSNNFNPNFYSVIKELKYEYSGSAVQIPLSDIIDILDLYIKDTTNAYYNFNLFFKTNQVGLPICQAEINKNESNIWRTWRFIFQNQSFSDTSTVVSACSLNLPQTEMAYDPSHHTLSYKLVSVSGAVYGWREINSDDTLTLDVDPTLASNFSDISFSIYICI